MSDFRWEGVHRNEFLSHRALAQLDGVQRSVRGVADRGYRAAASHHASFRDTGASKVSLEKGDQTDWYIFLTDPLGGSKGNPHASADSINKHTQTIPAALDAMGY